MAYTILLWFCQQLEMPNMAINYKWICRWGPSSWFVTKKEKIPTKLEWTLENNHASSINSCSSPLKVKTFPLLPLYGAKNLSCIYYILQCLNYSSNIYTRFVYICQFWTIFRIQQIKGPFMTTYVEENLFNRRVYNSFKIIKEERLKDKGKLEEGNDCSKLFIHMQWMSMFLSLLLVWRVLT